MPWQYNPEIWKLLIIVEVLPLLLLTVTQIVHAKIELDCPKGTYLTSDLQCNPNPPQKQPTNQNQTGIPILDNLPTQINKSGIVLNKELKAEMPKIDSGIAGILNGIDCMITGNANKTLCK